LTILGSIGVLDLSRNTISQIQPGAFDGLDMFGMMTSIISLAGNEIEILQENTFSGIQSVAMVVPTLLYLDSNHIQTIAPNAFANTTFVVTME
jgi:hypothetical protein